ncbi:hypothetical protein Ais01nite_69870 [Asanoa ishikariensis]|uniref:Uncharacterized membrane protein n=1 Tax=Asanoa ishikariensis TaxID=137265 RepID=A0A1H3MZR3_9ACTN|nr:hypothetical protein [Asanoa ishikariensis]GIF68952.1 hypothetical protein Ais01nite_69870 [Asanoa ishikariensis]SDY81980.1 Uncharacterized membrane protein [Asanoa ishikariensis]
METAALTSAFLVGVASGGRSMTGLAAVALTTRPGTSSIYLDRAASNPGRALLTAGAAAELVGDKLPGTPSRLMPRSLAIRITSGALGGAALALRTRGNPALGALCGGVGAVVGSYGGAYWRRWAGTERVTAFVAAVAEDLLTAATAVAASALAPQRQPERR